MNAEATLVADAAALRACVDECLSRDCVGVDTEFERRRTFYPKPALIQLSTGDKHWLVLAEAVAEDKTPLLELLQAERVVKIMHACREDALVLGLLTGFFVERVFDVQIANGLLGWQPQLSYHNLVRARLGEITATGETMSDWLQRPLSESQLRYAVDDVRWLPALYELTREELQAEGRLEWLWEDARGVCALAREEFDGVCAGELARRIKGYGRMPAPMRRVLRALCEWRDAEARRRDLPRRWILDDEALASIARRPPESEQALERMMGKKVRRGRARRMFKHLQSVDHPMSEPPPPPAVDREQARLLYEALRGRAAALGLDPSVVIARADCPPLISMLRDDDAMSGRRLRLRSWLDGWRASLLEGAEHLLGEAPLLEASLADAGR